MNHPFRKTRGTVTKGRWRLSLARLGSPRILQGVPQPWGQAQTEQSKAKLTKAERSHAKKAHQSYREQQRNAKANSL